MYIFCVVGLKLPRIPRMVRLGRASRSDSYMNAAKSITGSNDFTILYKVAMELQGKDNDKKLALKDKDNVMALKDKDTVLSCLKAHHADTLSVISQRCPFIFHVSIFIQQMSSCSY
jgi:hypothetical protein